MSISASRVQRDLAGIRARIDAIERGARRGSVAADVANSIASGGVKLSKRPGEEANEVRAAISYAKWLRNPRTTRGVPLIRGNGKKLYEQSLAELQTENRGSVILDEPSAVIAKLSRLPGGCGVRLISKPAPLQKFMAGAARMIRGWASTAELDRQGDILVPQGMSVRLPIALLWQHDHTKPIGTIATAEIRGNGVWIEAKLVDGIALADEALKLVEAKAIDAFSVGFRILKSEPLPNGGLKIVQWDLYEVSLVSVPANPGARIQRSVGGTSSDGSVRLVR
jgi:HK97 family phage prohead protease